MASLMRSVSLVLLLTAITIASRQRHGGGPLPGVLPHDGTAFTTMGMWPTALLANGQTVFERRPSNPGLTGAKPSPKNYICPQTVFEPRSPKLSMRYGPFTSYNGETITPSTLYDDVDGCGNSVALEDNGYINKVAQSRVGAKYEITQIVPSDAMSQYLDRSLWVCWKAPETTRVEVTTSRESSRLLVYAGCGCAHERAPLIGCVDGRDPNESGVHYSKKLVFDTVTLHDYMIRVGVLRGATDEDVVFDIQPQPVP